MKWMHIADLHIGKNHEAADLYEDQKAVLGEILQHVREEKPDGMLIAGDVYDRSVPAEKAVKLLDGFLTELSGLCTVYMISGNHDSGGRLSFAEALLAKQNVYVSGDVTGGVKRISQGDTDIYLMPYYPAEEARRLFDDPEITGTDSAVRAVLRTAEKGSGKYRILVAHLFATSNGQSPETSESETKRYKADQVGGLDGVDVSAFDGFDYVALGHIHAPQQIGRETVRYSGTPMMYSFSEQHHVKSIAVYEPESDTPVRLIPIKAGRRMRVVTGLLSQLQEPGFDPLSHDDIVLCELTDTVERPEARALLGNVYKTCLIRPVGLTRMNASGQEHIAADFSDPMSLLNEFFKKRRDREMTEEEYAVVSELMAEAEKEQ